MGSILTHFIKEASHRNHQDDDDATTLVEMMEYALERIPTLNQYCVICDCPHIFGIPLLKPAVCRRELCAFAFQQLHVMSSAVLATQAEVIDLLVHMAKAAAHSSRANLIFDPFPTVFGEPNAFINRLA